MLEIPEHDRPHRPHGPCPCRISGPWQRLGDSVHATVANNADGGADASRMNGKEIVCANHLYSDGSDGVDATDANHLPQFAPEKNMAPAGGRGHDHGVAQLLSDRLHSDPQSLGKEVTPSG